MKLSPPSLIKDSLFRNRIIIIFFALAMIIWGKISQHDYNPAKWMTYRNFDIPKQKNFINYLLPGVQDSSSYKVYSFKHKEYVLLYIVLFAFFPLMLFLRLIFDFDLKLRIYRGFTQWLTFVVARLGIFRVTGICPIKRTGLGVFPFMNCQSCELATGACPLGTFQMSLLNKQIPFVVIGQILLTGIISGRAVCGWLCPFGFLSDIFGKIPGKKIILNLKLTYLKYLFLAVLILTGILYYFKNSSYLFYCAFICPVGFYYGVLEYALTTGFRAMTNKFPFLHYMLLYHFLIGLIFLILATKLGGRFFCKFACPLGAVLGLFNKISLIKINVNSNKCNGCQACKNVCPMNITILNSTLLSKSNCILCGRCVKVCPSKKIEYSIKLSGSQDDKYELKMKRNDFKIKNHEYINN